MSRTVQIVVALVIGAVLGFGAASLSGGNAPGTEEQEGAGWRQEVKILRFGLIGGENVSDRLKRFDSYKKHMEERLGIPVKTYPTSDYAGVIQAMTAGQVDIAVLGSSGYAKLWLDSDGAVEPLVTNAESDGSVGYYAAMFVRAGSKYKTLEDLKGASLVFADPNSTSGYLIPTAELRAEGREPASFFGRTGFSGGHEQSVIAVLKGQYEAGVTWVSGVGDPDQGFTRGNLRVMVEKDMLDMKDLRIVWMSKLIPNGPIAVRKDMPQELKDLIRGMLVALHFENREAYVDLSSGDGDGYVAIDHGFYEPVIRMRQEELKARREQ